MAGNPAPDLATPQFAKFEQVKLGLNVAGFPGNYHTLSKLGTYGRRIVPVDDLGLHLVWKPGNSPFEFIKPLPRSFVTLPPDPVPPAAGAATPACTDAELTWPTEALPEATAGFVYSYTRLIESEVDLKLALDMGLVDERFALAGGVGWERWQAFVASFRKASDPNMHIRFAYGDLRLNRLRLSWLGRRFYNTRDQPLLSFSNWYIKWATVILVIASTVLSAMQVALAGNPDFGTTMVVFNWFAIAFLLMVAFNLAVGLTVGLFFGVWQVAVWGNKKRTNRKKKLTEVIESCGGSQGEFTDLQRSKLLEREVNM
ncbi:hypothetical protein OQA88_4453 [Cercophora sp. LCS_1]